jgi:hypothetical protein
MINGIFQGLEVFRGEPILAQREAYGLEVVPNRNIGAWLTLGPLPHMQVFKGHMRADWAGQVKSGFSVHVRFSYGFGTVTVPHSPQQGL